MRTQRILGLVLAGGEGRRLWPLTAVRAKPAVPFGGSHRLIDFVLSNLVNGGVRRLYVLTQYKSHSLDRHIAGAWSLSPAADQFVIGVPAQQRLGPRWYTGSADALFQSLNLIHDDEPDHVVVFGADHVYRFDPAQMIGQHVDSGADLTVAAIRVMSCATTPPIRGRHTTSAATSCRCWWRPATCTPTTSPAMRSPASASGNAATGVTSGRWTPTTTRTGIC